MNLIFLKNRVTVLFVFSVLLIIIFPLILIFDSKSLNDPYGIGIIVAFTTIFIGLIGIAIDYIFFKLIKNKWTLNIIELILISVFLYGFWPR